MAAYVKRAASLLGAKVTLLHVVDLTRFDAMQQAVRPPRECEQDHIDVGHEHLNAFLPEQFPQSHTVRLVAVGEPAMQIAQAARDGRFGLIIMPTYAGIFRKFLLGSTTAKVLDDADCPVLTGRHCHTIAPRPLDHREWLCAVGLGEDSASVLRFAAQGAAATHSRLCVIHTIEPDVEAQGSTAQSIAALNRSLGTHAAVSTMTGPAKQVLLDAALHADADVLIIGRAGRTSAHGRLRDLTYSVIRDSPCPVLSV
jgi:nucleotide-binding universal stress UspA family protein